MVTQDMLRNMGLLGNAGSADSALLQLTDSARGEADIVAGGARPKDLRITFMPRLSAAPTSTLSKPAQRMAITRVPPSARTSSTCKPLQAILSMYRCCLCHSGSSAHRGLIPHGGEIIV